MNSVKPARSPPSRLVTGSPFGRYVVSVAVGARAEKVTSNMVVEIMTAESPNTVCGPTTNENWRAKARESTMGVMGMSEVKRTVRAGRCTMRMMLGTSAVVEPAKGQGESTVRTTHYDAGEEALAGSGGER